MKRCVTTAVLIAGCALPAAAATIAPHRAIYDLSLAAAGSDSSLAAVDGRLAFEIMGAGCDGWTVSFRMANRYSPAEGSPRLVDTQSTSFESADATRLEYAEKNFINRRQDAEARVKVTRDNAAAPGAGKIVLPQAKEFELAAKAMFPMQHQLHLMNLAEHGQQRDTSLIYDGSDGANTFRAIAFIGREKAAGKNSRDQANPEAAGLDKLRSWPVSISYYATQGDDQDTPSYQVGFDLYEDGVATGLTMDYGTFKLQGELKKLEFLPQESCN